LLQQKQNFILTNTFFDTLKYPPGLTYWTSSIGITPNDILQFRLYANFNE